jgi:molybdopterin converting factor small subunit
MKIEIKLYASLARYMPDLEGGDESSKTEIREGTTVSRLLESLDVPPNRIKLIFLNGIHANGDEVLKNGDRLGVFPPVAGG